MTQIDPIDILKTGQGWLCVEKPFGMSVHNEPGHDLLSILATRIRGDEALMTTLGIDSGFEIHPVHRLDRDTSGVILLATQPATLSALSTLFQTGAVKKTYIALVHGNFDLAPGAVQVWDTPLSKEAGGRTNPKGRGKRVRAETRYKLLDQSAHYALLEIELLTGRKHQIRRHAKLGGHPVTGDRRYGSKRSVAFLRENQDFHRLGLHSFSIEFVLDKVSHTIRSRSIPPEIQTLLDNDR
ncbi:MAG: RNA pseudouridine synthase [Desulfobacteraceae bacterium]|nr:RNA pseudouridine synthase [Desulfobacteraceae bacterium]